MASGGAAGATALLVVYPIDLARFHAHRIRQGGFYNGFAITCIGVVLYRGAYFGLYDTFSDVDLMKRAGFFGKFALGYAVTVIAGLVSYPFDTIDDDFWTECIHHQQLLEVLRQDHEGGRSWRSLQGCW